MKNIYKDRHNHFQVKFCRNGETIYAGTFLTISEAIDARDKAMADHPENKISIQERFWSKVDKTSSKNGCWIWKAYISTGGYGIFRLHHRTYQAHRVAWELLRGEIPSGMMLDHLCFNKRCVNPNHLRIVTCQENCEHRDGAQRNNTTSGIRGVYWHKRNRKWRVQAKHNYRVYYGGDFLNLHDAEMAAIALRNRLMTGNILDRAICDTPASSLSFQEDEQ